MKNELVRFEQQHWGLTFNRFNNSIRSEITISDDGQICRSIRQITNDGTTTLISSYCNSLEGWLFSTVREIPQPPPEEARSGTPHSVAYGASLQGAKYLNDDFGGVDAGVVAGMPFTEFLNQSQVRLHSSNNSKTTLIANHPELPTTEFWFNKSGRLESVRFTILQNDVVPTTAKYEAKLIAPAKTSNTFRYDFRYQEFDSRIVLSKVKINFSASDNVNSSLTYNFANFMETSEPLTQTISLENEEIENGQEVSCRGRHGVRHEILDGRVVVAVDASSVEAARNARRGNSGAGWSKYYMLTAVLLVVSVVTFVWYRNREEGR